MATTKDRLVIYLSPATAAALADYQARRRGRFKSVSAAVEHLLGRALLGELDEGTEGLLAPTIARRVEEAAARAVEARVAPLLAAQTDRLAGLLVRGGKDALVGVGIGVAILERLTGDPEGARRLAEEARLAAGPAYTARGLRGGPGQE
jgi:hypothetical protein